MSKFRLCNDAGVFFDALAEKQFDIERLVLDTRFYLHQNALN